MTLVPLFEASLAIKIHVLTVIPAAVIGGWMLLARKGTPMHKLIGRIWVLLMAVAAISSFFISSIRLWGPFSPIHLLSIVTLVSCVGIVWTARSRRFKSHRNLVRSLYFGGIGIAGFFAFLPGRVMHEIVFGSLGDLATAIGVVIGTGFLVVAAARFGKFRRRCLVVLEKFMASAVLGLVLTSVWGENAQASPQISAIDIVTRAPLWVWPLLAALIWYGISRTRPRVVSPGGLLILPLAIGVTGLYLILTYGAAPLAFVVFGLAILPGVAVARRLTVNDGAWHDKDAMVHVPGEYTTLVIVLCIFLLRFVAGATVGIAPDYAHSLVLALPFSGFYGFALGLTLTRARIQLAA